MVRCRAMRFVLSVALVAATHGLAAGADHPGLRITTPRPDDKVQVHVESSRTTVSVHSPAGISRARIERQGPRWPCHITLRLHLKGLEKLKITSGPTTLQAAVSSQNDPNSEAPRVRLWKDGREDEPLDSEHPYWMPIRLLGADGQPTKSIPAEQGRFEMPLPRALFDNNPKQITIDWIDFYR